MEMLDHKSDPSKLWITIKAIDGKSPPKAENKAITFYDSQVTSPKLTQMSQNCAQIRLCRKK